MSTYMHCREDMQHTSSGKPSNAERSSCARSATVGVYCHPGHTPTWTVQAAMPTNTSETKLRGTGYDPDVHAKVTGPPISPAWSRRSSRSWWQSNRPHQKHSCLGTNGWTRRMPQEQHEPHQRCESRSPHRALPCLRHLQTESAGEALQPTRGQRSTELSPKTRRRLAQLVVIRRWATGNRPNALANRLPQARSLPSRSGPRSRDAEMHEALMHRTAKETSTRPSARSNQHRRAIPSRLACRRPATIRRRRCDRRYSVPNQQQPRHARNHPLPRRPRARGSRRALARMLRS